MYYFNAMALMTIDELKQNILLQKKQEFL